MHAIARRTLLASLAALPAAARAQAPKDRLVIGLENYPPNLHPFLHTGSASGSIKILVNRGLLSHDIHGKLQPELAESWGIENGVDYTFRLRPNAKFHNGMPVQAEDVAYSFNLIRNDPAARMSSAMNPVESIETPDPLTIRLRLRAPAIPFAEVLGNLNCAVISAKAHKADPTSFVGCGPYRITGQERGSYIELAAVRDFYKPGRPKLARIKAVTYIDDVLRAAALDTGDVDIIQDVPWSRMAAVAANPRLVMQAVNGAFMFFTFNTTQGPFANPKVRQAVAIAINRADVLNAAFSGKGVELAGLPIPEDSPFFNPDTANLWPYDPARARTLLAEAGYPQGFSTTLLSTVSPAMHAETSIVVQQSLAAIGITATLKTTDWATRVALGNKGQYEIAMNGTAPDYNDTDALSALIGPGALNYQRSPGFNSPTINALLAQGRTEPDPAKRRTIYAALSRQVGEETPMVFLNWRAQAYAMQKSVQGFHNMPGFLTFHSCQTLEDTSFAA